jgi:uracil-DNA glycosylase
MPAGGGAMPWTERQHAMLRAMGLRLWSPPCPVHARHARRADRVRWRRHAGRRRPRAAGARGRGAGRSGRVAPAGAASAAPSRGPAVCVTRAPAAALPTDAEGRAAAIATLDWPALREAVAGCRACALCEGRRHTVFGTGGTQAHWMVVGEAPGEQEDRQGEPFVGPAGRLLDQMLAALGLTRDAEGAAPARQVYIANTLKCRPPGNRNPAPEEMARCEPFLQRQIALLRPRIILAMGRFAVQSLLRTTEAVGRLRGRVHRYQGVPLVVTYHPAYLLRNLPDKARAWQDLCLAAATVDAAGTDPADAKDDNRHDAERR